MDNFNNFTHVRHHFGVLDSGSKYETVRLRPGFIMSRHCRNMTDHRSTTCSSCNVEIRKESYITHIMNTHQGHFWDEILCFYNEKDTGLHDLRSRHHLKDAISVLQDNSPYELDDELYVDFGDKGTYKNSHTATKHIMKHPDKHKANFVELIRQSLSEERLLTLFKWIIAKPIKVIQDENYVKEKLAKGYQEIERKNEAFHKELEAARIQVEQIMRFKETNAYKDAVKLNETQYQLSAENRELRQQINTLKSEISEYENSYLGMEAKNYNTMTREIEELSYWEKAKKNLEAKVKKHEEECDKKVKRAVEEFETYKEKAEKKEKKFKIEIKAYKQELERAKAKKELSSDSDSD